MQLTTINRTMTTIEGPKSVWMLSTGDQPASQKSVCLAIGMPEKTFKQVCFVNGAIEVNGLICFETEERATAAISALQRKAEMTPQRAVGSSSFTGANAISVTWQLPVNELQEILEQYVDDEDEVEVIMSDIQNGDVNDAGVFNPISEYFSDNLGVDISDWNESELSIVEENGFYVITFSGRA